MRETAGGKHVAVTLEVPVKDAEDVIAVYRRRAKAGGVGVSLGERQLLYVDLRLLTLPARQTIDWRAGSVSDRRSRRHFSHGQIVQENQRSFPGHPRGQSEKAQPLAARMRPRTLDEFVGQEHFLGPGKLLRRMLRRTGSVR